MKASDIPALKFPVPFGSSATSSYIRTVPETTTDPNAASLVLGWPPNTATPVGAGGSPPDVRDANGILYQISAWTRWQNAGAPVFYDSAFSADIGGYPQGTVLASSVTLGLVWYSLVDNNGDNPDTTPANWKAFSFLENNVALGGQRFASSGGCVLPDYITPTDGVRITVKGAGGGGGGTSGVNGNGGGGGEGEEISAIFYGFNGGDTVVFTLAAGGAGGNAGAGIAGADTTVSYQSHTIMTAKGGAGGGFVSTRLATRGGAGGTGGSVSIAGTTLSSVTLLGQFAGAPGSPGLSTSDSNCICGNGGGSGGGLGPCGDGGSPVAGVAGVANSGGGGSGALGASQIGGAGGSAVITFEWLKKV